MSTSSAQLEWVQQRWCKARELQHYGWRPGAIATALEVTTQTLNQWLKDCPASSPSWIRAKAPMQATVLTAEEQTRLHRLLQRLPSDFGFTVQQWTPAQVRILIEQLFDISLPDGAFADTLYLLTVQATQPHKQDATEAEISLLRGRLKKYHRIRKLQKWALEHQTQATPLVAEPVRLTTEESGQPGAFTPPSKPMPSGLGKFKSGPPTKLTLEQLHTLPQLLLKPPHAYGLTGTVWTYKQIALLIEQQYQVTFSPDYIPDFLKRARRRLEKLGHYLEQQ